MFITGKRGVLVVTFGVLGYVVFPVVLGIILERSSLDVPWGAGCLFGLLLTDIIVAIVRRRIENTERFPEFKNCEFRSVNDRKGEVTP